MNDEQTALLRDLMAGRSTAALGTLHSGAPYVSMVTFALFKDEPAFVIHVSLLAAHTKDTLADARVSLLITGHEQQGVSPQALPRVTILGTARPVSADSGGYALARRVYLDRFPEAAPIFNLGDFSLFLITPTAVRWIAGFAQARSLSAEVFARIIQD